MPDWETQLRVFFIAQGECLRRRREAMGWTQREFARRAGLSRSEVQFVENGKRHPRQRTVRCCCRALGITPIELESESDRVARTRLLHLACKR